MEQEVLQTRPTAMVELLEQGGLNIHWDRLMDTIREGVQGLTEWDMADIARKLRGRQLVAIALWLGERVHGYAVLQPATLKDSLCMNVYAIHGKDISIEQWGVFIDQVSDVLRLSGYTRMVAITQNPRVLEICRRTGWGVSNYCERVL